MSSMVEPLDKIANEEFQRLGSLYFNSAYFGPSPNSAREKVQAALHKELDPSFYDYNQWMGVSERVREQFAELFGTAPGNIAHGTATSDFINQIIFGAGLKPGDHIASIDKDYPSNVLPLMLAKERLGVEFDLISLGEQVLPTAEWLEKKLHPNTKIFCVSHVTFDTGKRVDILNIGKMCRKKGILFVVDGTQGFGGLKLSKEEIDNLDIFICSSYKWILGPYGHAFGYFRKEAQERVQHQNANWVKSPNSKVVYSLLDYTTDTLPGARKYDRGQTSNFLINAALEGAIEVLKRADLNRVQKANAELSDYFLDNYPKNKYELITPIESRANILCLRGKNIDPLSLERELKFRNLDVSVRQGNVRLSFHFFNNREQVETLIKALDI